MPEDVPIVVIFLLKAVDVEALALAPGCEDPVPAVVVAGVTAPVSRLRVGLEVEPLTVTGPNR